MRMEERKYWIDYGRTIAILFVITRHFHLQSSRFESFIFAFDLPFFFLISGFLSKKSDSLIGEIRNNFKTLLIPYLYFYILTYLTWLPGYLHHPELFPDRSYRSFLIKPFLGMLFAAGYNTTYSTREIRCFYSI